MPLFGKKKEKEKKKGDARKPPSPESPPRYAQTAGRNSTSPKPSPSSSLQNLPRKDGKDGGVGAAAGRGVRRDAQYVGSVKDKVTQYEQKRGVISASYTSLNSRERSVASPPPSSSTTTSQHSSHASLLRPDVRSQGGSSLSSGTSPAPDQVTINVPTSTSSTTTYQPSSLCGFESPPAITETPPPAAKLHDGHHLPLPPLQTATVQHRHVVAEKNQQNGGGFGFILRQSYLPVPEDPGQTRLVHLVEPRPDYMGPLMTGDRIIEVNGSVVEDEPHDKVVELIKASGDRVELMVASMPELHELNARVFQGSDNPFANRGSNVRKSTKMKPGQTGTLRKQAAKAKKEFKAKSVEEVLSDKRGLEHERVWVVHKAGFSLGTVQPETSLTSNFPSHFNIIRYQGRDVKKVKLAHSDDIIEVEEEDLEKASPASQDTVEDLVDLTHLNEPSVLHVLRQRYGSSLIHTFAGRHLIVLNPLRPLSCYVDRVIDMFRGCRREDMPPHIFAAGQQAYRNMMTTRCDQSLVLMGLSGSGKTFNARYLLRYLATIGQTENAVVTNAKLDAVELLLHSFGSAATFLNPQATRCTCLYTLDFDPSGSVISAQVRTYLLEKTRVASHPEGEGNFNIFYQLIAGADDHLTSELMLDALPGEEPNLYVGPHDNEQRIESAAYVWDLIQNCLDILGISEDEALGLWSLLAAIYHLGYAGVKKSSVRGSECFLNPASAQRAAIILGIDHEDLGKDIFNPPRGASYYLPSLLSSPSQSSSLNLSDTGSIHSYGSPIIAAQSGNRSAALDAFIMGLYEQAVSALVMLINRALQGSSNVKSRSSIHVLDTPGFQHRELAGDRSGASFDELCMNYTQERLHMLFHDVTFTSEQDRYIQENINWMFSESPESPLPVIDAIDKHIGRRGMSVDLNTDRRGLLWILEEESVFPGASDGSFLDRVHMYHGKSTEMGEPPLIKVMKEENQFQIRHCQRSLSVLYDANGWVKRAREHPSFRIVAQVMADSKKECIGSVFQGRGVAASATNISTSALKVDTVHSSLTRTRSTQNTNLYSSPAGGIKKSSVCLQTKFQLDSLIDALRKTRQWFIRCILPQLPCKLPGALPSPDPVMQAQAAEPAPHGVVNVPLIKAQLQRADIVKAARIFKQGFPEHMSFPEFCRRYGTIETLDVPLNTREAVQQILMLQEVPSHTYKLGSSQVFLRSGILPKLDQRVEAHTHNSMVLFQARCRGYLGRKQYKELEVLDSAAYVIQSNVLVWMEIRDWSWWQLYTKIKPMLAIWRVEREMKEKQNEINKLAAKVEKLEIERDALQETERVLSEKVQQVTMQMRAAEETASQAEEMLETEQVEKRGLEEQLTEMTVREKEVIQEKEQLHLQIAEMSILARIKQEEGEPTEQQEGYMEKYWETKRELETLRQRLSTERDDELETLETSKRSLEKKLADSEAEVEELNRTLAQLRKKTVKQGQELNDLKLHLESQQARNEELEKRQRKFDSDLNVAREGAVTERQEKEKLARDRHTLRTDFEELQTKLKETQEELEKANHEREDLQAELLQQTSASTESELTSLKRMKRELESKLEAIEDELDEANIKVDNLQQGKARLEVANQTLKAQHQKELEGREEELEQIKATTNKKLKVLGDQVEELHEEKQQAVKARRDLERELAQYQNRAGDPEVEKKLKKQVYKYKALLQSGNEELERLRDSSKTSALVRSLRNQLDEQQASTQGAVKSLKRVQDELDESVVQVDELTRSKLELEARVSDLTREKSDLESRVEEDQDEIEEVTGKQRALISQNTLLQTQLAEAHQQVTELEDHNVTLESKLGELNAKMSDMESGINRQQYEASEVKVRELEQKLDLERSAVRRLENQVQRLRGQLERLHKQEGDDSSQKSSEALRRMQKQLREVRLELQEAERKEQDMARKKRAAESQVQELEVRLQNSEADLKTAERRVTTLQDALKVQEEEFGSGDEDGEDVSRSYDDLSSSGGSYQIGELTGSMDDLSDGQDKDGRLSNQLMGLRGGRSITPRAEDYTSPSHRARRRRFDRDLEEDKLSKHTSNVDEDGLLFERRTKFKVTSTLSDEEEDLKPKKKSYLSKYSDEEDTLRVSPSHGGRSRGLDRESDDEWKSSHSHRGRTKLTPGGRDSEEEEGEGGSRRRYNRTHIISDEDDDITSWRRKRDKRLSDEEEEADMRERRSPRRGRDTASPLEDIGSSRSRRRDQLSDREEDKDSAFLTSRDDPRTGRWDKTKSVSPTHLNGATPTSLPNGTKTSNSSLAGDEKSVKEESVERAKQRKDSIKNLVSKEQEQLYSVAQNRRRRRRTGDAKSTRRTAQNTGSTS